MQNRIDRAIKMKQRILQRFIMFILKIRLQTEETHINIPFSLIQVFYLINTIQYTGQLVYCFNGQYQNTNGIVKILNVLTQILMPIKLSDSQSFIQKGYLIPLGWIVVRFIGYLFQFIYIDNKKYHNKESSQYNRVSGIFIIKIFLELLFVPIFYLPFLEMIIKSITINILSNIEGTIVGIIVLFFLFVIVFQNQIYRLSISINIKNLTVLNQSQLDFWIFLIISIIILIESLNLEFFSKFYLIFSMLIFSFICQIWNIFQNYPNYFLNIEYQLIYYLSSIVISIVLWLRVLEIIKTDNIDILIILFGPLICYFGLQNLKTNHNKVLLNQENDESCEIIQYRISNILKDFNINSQFLLQNHFQILQIQIYHMQHKQFCYDVKCNCSNLQINQFDIIIRNYLVDQASKFGNAIRQLKEKSNIFQFFIHYISLINLLNLNSNAFQQTNQALNQNQEKQTQNIQYQKFNKQQSLQQYTHTSNHSKSSITYLPNIKLQSLSYLEKQKLLIVQDKLQRTMNSNFYQKKQVSTQDQLEYAVKLFLESEYSNQRLKSKLLKILHKKQDYFNRYITQNAKFNIFKESKSMIRSIEKLDILLTQMYKQFPSQKLQALNTFFQSEIRNNYFTAYKLANVTSISDEKLLKMHTSFSFDLFSNKVVYLIIGFDQKSQKPIIQQHSNLVHEFFGLDLQQFNHLQNIDPLLPHGFQNIHQKLISTFLETGESKFFRTNDQSFCTIKNSELKSIDFFFDVDFKNMDSLNFACFFQEFAQQSSFVFVSAEFYVLSYTRNLYDKLHCDQEMEHSLFKALCQTNIHRIFPNFQEFIQQQISQRIDTFNPDLIILNSQAMKFPSQLHETEQTIIWNSKLCTNTFLVDGQVLIRYIDDEIAYYIIEIQQAKKVNHNQITIMSVNELQDLNIANEMQSEREIQIFQNMNLDMNKSLEQMTLQNCQPFFPIRQIEFPEQQNFIFSPQNGTKLFVAKSEKLLPQQEFYRKYKGNGSISVIIDTQRQEIKQEINNKLDAFLMVDIDQDLQDNIKMQMQLDEQVQKIVHIDDIGSQASSLAGIKKSKYYKKYELLDRMINSNKFSLNFTIMLAIISTYIVISVIFQISMIIKSQSDFDRFLQELDMLQIRSSFIGPFDKFQVCLTAATNNIIISVYLNMMPISQAIERMQYAQKEIPFSYEELHQNFVQQMQNQYLNQFFQDQYIIVYTKDSKNFKIYNITIREAMNLYLEACYELSKLDIMNIVNIDLNTPFIIFCLKNYETFNELFKSLNKEMLKYSINRAYLVSEEWMSIFIPLSVSGVLFFIFGFIYYRLYLKYYESMISLFCLIEDVWIQRDLDRYVTILSLLQKDTDILFKYTFDIDLKEKFLVAEDLRKDKLAMKQNQSAKSKRKYKKTIQLQINKLPGIVSFTTCFLCIFLFTFISNFLGQTYLTKYAATTIFYNKLADLSIASSGVLSMKQFAQQIQQQDTEVLSFFNHDATYFIQIFFENIQIINNFLSVISTFQQSDYLTSIQFTEQLNLLLKTDVCQFLPEYKQVLAQSHCDLVYGGVLRLGYQQSLITMRDSLLNDFDITKNFTIVKYSTDEELEMGLIGYDVINQLRSQFYVELIAYTNRVKTQILGVNLGCICLVISLNILITTVVKTYFKREFKMVKSFVQLLPYTPLFLDDSLDREIRQLIVKYNLI